MVQGIIYESTQGQCDDGSDFANVTKDDISKAGQTEFKVLFYVFLIFEVFIAYISVKIFKSKSKAKLLLYIFVNITMICKWVPLKLSNQLSIPCLGRILFFFDVYVSFSNHIYLFLSSFSIYTYLITALLYLLFVILPLTQQFEAAHNLSR